ncbi:hypothetical protein LOK49_Contig181G00009 [Camellia lanceoleosa]|nr:hypothetical protein LOK49_Contig181G00009 [Camellia lanceoleosa]
MMTFEKKEKITKAYEQNDDGAVIWTGVDYGVSVCFTDIKNLIRGQSVRGNIIDAYTCILLTEQGNVSSGDDLTDKSYFFSSICMKERVSSVLKRSLQADGIDELSIVETFNHPFESIAYCSQQRADSKVHWCCHWYLKKDVSGAGIHCQCQHQHQHQTGHAIATALNVVQTGHAYGDFMLFAKAAESNRCTFLASCVMSFTVYLASRSALMI